MKRKALIFLVGCVLFAVSICTFKVHAVYSQNTSNRETISTNSQNTPLLNGNTQDKLEEKTKLEQILGITGYYERETKIANGELSTNHQRLTIEQAIQICEAFPKDNYTMLGEFECEICKRFNEIAGAPDYTGGNGIQSTYYYLNDDFTESLIVSLGRVIYVKNGSMTTIFKWADS